uniref:5'-3' exonuclease PLD3 n=1 Tax=Amazona collaria TaxID=241587 RepID=A0A8B9G3N3_9PSIT
MTFGSGSAPNPSTFSAWMRLLSAATRSLDIASFYWTMTNADTGTAEPSAAQVRAPAPALPSFSRRFAPIPALFHPPPPPPCRGSRSCGSCSGYPSAASPSASPSAARRRRRPSMTSKRWSAAVRDGNTPKPPFLPPKSRPSAPNWGGGDLPADAARCPAGAAVRTVDMPRLTGGVLHTKFWLVDGAHLYVGSANMDWRSLTQVKELGAAVYDCGCLARDLGKIFEAYWALGVPGASIPVPWPANYSTAFNAETPLELQLNGTAAAVYLSSSPPALCAAGRTQDLSALLSVIAAAEAFVDIAVMSFLPTTEFSHPQRSVWGCGSAGAQCRCRCPTRFPP